MPNVLDTFRCLSTLKVGQIEYSYMSLKTAEANGLQGIAHLPFTLKVLMENLLRKEDGKVVNEEALRAVDKWTEQKKSNHEVAFHPARVLMQDFTGVPAVVDLASMREAMSALKGDPKKINPLSPVDLVIDHSVMVDHFGNAGAFKANVDLEFQRNAERYELLRWGQQAFDNFRVVPPGTGICHQVNLEYLGQVVFTKDQGQTKWAYPDSLVGTDSHTTMINGLSILGWGVGGIEAEAAMLAQPISMMIPEVVGFKLTGEMKEGTTATDLVLTVTQMLRAKGVVGKFVEFYGDGLDHLSLADRATIANMAPEYGATCGYFPIDRENINFLKFTGRENHQIDLVEAYAKAQGLWREAGMEDPWFTDTLNLNMSDVKPSLAGPKRPQDRIDLELADVQFEKALRDQFKVASDDMNKKSAVEGAEFQLEHGSVAIAAITSCTNTSNPTVMIAAGLVAKKASALGLKVKPWVKTSLAPGSQVVSDYLEAAGLQTALDDLGFNLVGYGCTTCIGNSGPLKTEISQAIASGNLVACSVLSGNRNFEGRISQDVKANYLASPPLVVAYAIAGSLKINVLKDSIGKDSTGRDVFLKDIWPTSKEVRETLATALTPEMFKSRYSDVFTGPSQWQDVKPKKGFTFDWQNASTYVRNPPFFEGMEKTPRGMADIHEARPLAILGDNVTTDHISPAGAIKPDSPAGEYLMSHGVKRQDFNSYGSRRGNHEVMMRGTFANIRIRNEMMPGIEGGLTRLMPDDSQMSIFDAAMAYQERKIPLVVIGGKEYGMGSSRDWAAKGTRLLGVRVVITESFERIHRSNLIGMGVLPLQFTKGQNRTQLKLNGSEMFSISGISSLSPRSEISCTIKRTDGSSQSITLLNRIDTEDELSYFQNGGILQYVIRKLL